MPKDGCNNMERNAILRFHDAGEKIPEIARKLRLTERIVENMVSHYRPNSNVKAGKKIDTGLNDSTDAADEFDTTDDED